MGSSSPRSGLELLSSGNIRIKHMGLISSRKDGLGACSFYNVAVFFGRYINSCVVQEKGLYLVDSLTGIVGSGGAAAAITTSSSNGCLSGLSHQRTSSEASSSRVPLAPRVTNGRPGTPFGGNDGSRCALSHPVHRSSIDFFSTRSTHTHSDQFYYGGFRCKQ
jgi:hypothetical protein